MIVIIDEQWQTYNSYVRNYLMETVFLLIILKVNGKFVGFSILIFLSELFMNSTSSFVTSLYTAVTHYIFLR